MRKCAAMMILISGMTSAHSMSPAIKKYVVHDVNNFDVLLVNSGKDNQCYNVYVNDMPHLTKPKVCLLQGKQEKIKVFIKTPPNEISRSKVCTERVQTQSNSKRFQLCTAIVTYFPQKELLSSSE